MRRRGHRWPPPQRWTPRRGRGRAPGLVAGGGGPVGEVAELLGVAVRGADEQRLALAAGLALGGLEHGDGRVGDLALGGALRDVGVGPGGGPGRGGGRPVGVADAVDPLSGDGAEVRAVARDEGVGGIAGAGEALELVLVRLEVLEGPGGTVEQLVVERAEPLGEDLGELRDVEVLGELGAAQEQHQVDERVVALGPEAEERSVDERPVVGAPLDDVVGAEHLAELALGERPALGVDDVEAVGPDGSVGHEEPRGDGVAVALGAHADADGAHVVGTAGLVGVGAGHLHPHVPVVGLTVAVEEVLLHGAPLPAEGVEALGDEAGVVDEREQQLERLGLARAVRAAEHQAAVGEREDLVAVVPQPDDAGAAGAEPPAHGGPPVSSAVVGAVSLVGAAASVGAVAVSAVSLVGVAASALGASKRLGSVAGTNTASER